MVKLRTTLFFVGSLLQVTKLSPTPQVVGVKYLRLYAPSESRHLYPREVAQLHQGSSSWRVAWFTFSAVGEIPICGMWQVMLDQSSRRLEIAAQRDLNGTVWPHIFCGIASRQHVEEP